VEAGRKGDGVKKVVQQTEGRGESLVRNRWLIRRKNYKARMAFAKNGQINGVQKVFFFSLSSKRIKIQSLSYRRKK
jgi:hypothetical protein